MARKLRVQYPGATYHVMNRGDRREAIFAGPKHTGEDIRQSADAKAERIVAEELARLGWADQDLQGHRKGDGRKVRIAERLRRETTMTLAWIAARLHMGAPGHVACLLYRNHQETAGSENKLF